MSAVIHDPMAELVRAALRRLRVERLVLSIHSVSFPAGPDDIGHGTPYGARAADFVDMAAQLGFTGVALGPAGVTSRHDPSPYDGTALSRNPLHIALGPLASAGVVDASELARAGRDRPEGPDRAAYDYAWAVQRRLLRTAVLRLRAQGGSDLAARVRAARAAWPWLAAEARYEAIAAAEGQDDWRRWRSGAAADPDTEASFEIEQLIVHDQHRAFRDAMRARGLALYGDLTIGVSHRDRFIFARAFLADYLMGAPPSRTNPGGQPWGYAVLDPAALGEGGAARAFLDLRVAKSLAEHDGVRVDHPHGWVCPWVYRADMPDALRAVQQGARLFESPDLGDHPGLARYARVRAEQIDRALPRHADRWVRELEPAQIDAYAAALGLLVDGLHDRGGDRRDLMVEVLSTCPTPLAAVLRRFGLGRFRVTQKADTTDPSDVYRGDQALAEDWIMVGNHDTPPLARVVRGWMGTRVAEDRARYLAARLCRDPSDAGRTAEHLARDATEMQTAMVAELLLGPAENVLVFWVDLFGLDHIYNRPGEVHDDNWSLRVPPDFESVYASRVADGRAPDLRRALTWALRARGLADDDEGRSLAGRLEAAALSAAAQRS
jgi:4-alpha-glucanotransferase